MKVMESSSFVNYAKRMLTAVCLDFFLHGSLCPDNFLPKIAIHRQGDTGVIPPIKTCLQLMERYGMLENIKEHSIVVAKVACLIARGLHKAGEDISITKTVAAALLHDIGKTESLKFGGDHSEIGRSICLENHLDEIADIVAEHVVLRDPSLEGDYSETEIIFYADKRVNHDQIVTLEERLAYILKRYGRNQADLCHAIRLNFELCSKVEKKLFMKLEFEPSSLADIIR